MTPSSTPGAVIDAAPASVDAARPAPHATAAPLIDRFFHAMCAMKASDLHLSAGMPPLVRKDGEMRLLEENAAALSPDDVLQLLEPIRRKEPDRIRAAPRHRLRLRDRDLGRFRANIFMDRKGRGAVFRVIPSKILTAEDLGLSPHILQLCRLNKGLHFVTGPTGSGKSTTLCAMIDYINRTRTDHIITIEDPIEFVHENKKCLINQREHTRIPHRSRTPCVRHFARIPTSSWSEKCATSRPSPLRSRPPKRATSSSGRSIPRRRRRPWTA